MQSPPTFKATIEDWSGPHSALSQSASSATRFDVIYQQVDTNFNVRLVSRASSTVSTLSMPTMPKTCLSLPNPSLTPLWLSRYKSVHLKLRPCYHYRVGEMSTGFGVNCARLLRKHLSRGGGVTLPSNVREKLPWIPPAVGSTMTTTTTPNLLDRVCGLGRVGSRH